MKSQHYQDQPKEADKMTTEKRKRGRPKKVKEEPKEQLKRHVVCKLNYETDELKPKNVAEMHYNERSGEFIVNNTIDAGNPVHNALRDFQQSRVYTRIDSKTMLKTFVGDTGSLDIWISDFEKGEAFLEPHPQIGGRISIELSSISYEAE